jgi:uncharacterized protein (TIGR03067 family)
VKDIVRRALDLTLLLSPGFSGTVALSVPSDPQPRLARRLADLDELQAACEAAKIQGTWAATFGKYEGRRWSPGKVLGFKLTVEGKRYKVDFGDGAEEGAYRLTQGRCGYVMDLLPATGPLAGEVVRAIYQVEAKCLMICLAAPGEGRPAQFSAEPGTEQILIVLRPVKP